MIFLLVTMSKAPVFFFLEKIDATGFEIFNKTVETSENFRFELADPTHQKSKIFLSKKTALLRQFWVEIGNQWVRLLAITDD